MNERYVAPEPGGYQRDAGAAFGAGTLRPCAHLWVRKTALTRGGYAWRFIEASALVTNTKEGWHGGVPAAMVEQLGDTPGTVRCAGCGRRREDVGG